MKPVEAGLTPINLTFIIIGTFRSAVIVILLTQIPNAAKGLTDFSTMILSYYNMVCTPQVVRLLVSMVRRPGL